LWSIIFYEVIILGVEPLEDGISDARIFSSDMRLYLIESKLHGLVSWMSNLIQSRCRE